MTGETITINCGKPPRPPKPVPPRPEIEPGTRVTVKRRPGTLLKVFTVCAHSARHHQGLGRFDCQYNAKWNALVRWDRPKIWRLNGNPGSAMQQAVPVGQIQVVA